MPETKLAPAIKITKESTLASRIRGNFEPLNMAKPQIPLRAPTRRSVPEIENPVPERIPEPIPAPAEPLKVPAEPVPLRR